MATTTYRFVGDVPEVFASWSSLIAVEGIDPEATPWANGEPNAGYQAPGELRPGQTFTGPSDLLGEVGHARIERKGRGGKWAATVASDPAAVELEPEGEGDPPADDTPEA